MPQQTPYQGLGACHDQWTIEDKLTPCLDPLKGGIVVFLELNHIVERRQKGKDHAHKILDKVQCARCGRECCIGRAGSGGHAGTNLERKI
jgi:hypothetical protein